MQIVDHKAQFTHSVFQWRKNQQTPDLLFNQIIQPKAVVVLFPHSHGFTSFHGEQKITAELFGPFLLYSEANDVLNMHHNRSQIIDNQCKHCSIFQWNFNQSDFVWHLYYSPNSNICYGWFSAWLITVQYLFFIKFYLEIFLREIEFYYDINYEK